MSDPTTAQPRIITDAIFGPFNLRYSGRLIWLYLALYGPVNRAALYARMDIPEAIVDRELSELYALKMITEHGPDVIDAAFPELMINSPEYLINSEMAQAATVSSLRHRINNVDNFPKNVDNYVDKCLKNVDNYVDNSNISGVLRSSNSSDLVNVQENEENDVLTSSAKNQKRGRPRGPVATGDDEFDRFWIEYPKDAGKKQANAEFVKIKKVDGAEWPETFAAIMTGLEHAKQTDKWTRDNGQYIPDGFRWLKQGRWTDRLPLAISASTRIPLARPPEYRRETIAPSNAQSVTDDDSRPLQVTTTRRAAPQPSTKLIQVLKVRFKLEAEGRMIPDVGLLDSADLEIMRRDPIGRSMIRDAEINSIQRIVGSGPAMLLAIMRRGAAWRVGHYPKSADDWETEFLIRESEISSIIAEWPEIAEL